MTALITGATSGIGLEIAKILAKRGYDLIVTGRDETRLREAGELLQNLTTGTVTPYSVDLSTSAGAQKLFTFCQEKKLTVDILVNNAGHGYVGDHLDIDPTTIHNMLECNVVALTDLCSLFGREMRARRAGYILNIASTAAYQPLPYFAAYAASKTYVLHFSEALAMELRPHGVTVTCFSPGATDTRFFGGAGVADKTTGTFATSARTPAEVVAKAALGALFAKRVSTLYGFKGRFYAWLVRLTPRRLVVAISEKFMQRR